MSSSDKVRLGGEGGEVAGFCDLGCCDGDFISLGSGIAESDVFKVGEV